MLKFKMVLTIDEVEHDAEITVSHSRGTDWAIDSASLVPNDPEEVEFDTIEIDGVELTGAALQQAELEALSHLMRNYQSIKKQWQKEGAESGY